MHLPPIYYNGSKQSIGGRIIQQLQKWRIVAKRVKKESKPQPKKDISQYKLPSEEFQNLKKENPWVQRTAEELDLDID